MQLARLLDLDPDLGEHLDEAEWPSARRRVVVAVESFAEGTWRSRLAAARRGTNAALLIADGLLLRETCLGGWSSAELLGPGDVVHPADADRPSTLVEAHWRALSTGRVALRRDRAESR